uniref:SAP domain-containing protein n=1 Tax=viral metagenome TaxID=1070528 RepID=A0A6C0BL83_9ZZZZ
MDIITSLSLEFRSSNDTVPGRFQPPIELSSQSTGMTLFNSQGTSGRLGLNRVPTRPLLGSNQARSNVQIRPESSMPVAPNIRDNRSLRVFSPSQVNYSVDVTTPASAYESRYSKPITLMTQRDLERAERRTGIKALGTSTNPGVRVVSGVAIDMDKLNANASRGRKESYTVKELQGIASDLGLNAKGTKPVLVKTIRDRIEAEDLAESVGDQSMDQSMDQNATNTQEYVSHYNPENSVNMDDTFNQYTAIDDPRLQYGVIDNLGSQYQYY